MTKGKNIGTVNRAIGATGRVLYNISTFKRTQCAYHWSNWNGPRYTDACQGRTKKKWSRNRHKRKFRNFHPGKGITPSKEEKITTTIFVLMRIAKVVRGRRKKSDNLVFIVCCKVIIGLCLLLQNWLLWNSGIQRKRGVKYEKSPQIVKNLVLNVCSCGTLMLWFRNVTILISIC